MQHGDVKLLHVRDGRLIEVLMSGVALSVYDILDVPYYVVAVRSGVEAMAAMRSVRGSVSR